MATTSRALLLPQVTPTLVGTLDMAPSVREKTGQLKSRFLMWQPHTCTGGERARHDSV